MGKVELNSREDLAAFVRGLRNWEIEEKVQAEGIDYILRQVFDGVEQEFVPERGPGRDVIVQWNIVVARVPHPWTMHVSAEKCSVVKGPADKPEVELRVSISDYLRIIAGTLNEMKAVLTRRLKVSGDFMLAQEVPSWFEHPPP